MDMSVRSVMCDGIKFLMDKLRVVECCNRELSGFV